MGRLPNYYSIQIYFLACFCLILLSKEFVTRLVHDTPFENYMRGLAFCHEKVFSWLGTSSSHSHHLSHNFNHKLLHLHKIINFQRILDTEKMNNTSSERYHHFLFLRTLRCYKVEQTSVSAAFMY